MQALKPRHGSSEMAHKTSPRTTTKGSPVASLDYQDSKASKVLERKPSSKAMLQQQPEKRGLRATEMQQQLGQLEEELKKAKEERSQALQELAETKKGMHSQINENEASLQGKKRAELLLLEVDKAKESEQKMLESLISQTKQLEQTKISFEEAKLEVRSLQESIMSMNGSNEEIRVLRNELKLATEAEEKSKKAMDDLAIALKEVTTEANQAKGQLSSTQFELQKAGEEVERLKALLKITEEKFRAVVEESDEVKLELEESIVAWAAKENGFIDCMKVWEEEMSKANQENDRLIDSQRLSREDNSKLRDILKQAVNEATVVKEALEIARTENSQIKDLLAEKESALQRIKQDYECLKVSEAAALGSVRELRGLLAATSVDSSKSAKSNEVRESKNTAALPSGQWTSENPRSRYGRRHSVGGDGKFKGSALDTERTLDQGHRIAQSVSNVTDSLVPPSFSDDGGSLNFDDFNLIDRSQLNGMEQDHGSLKQKKKTPMIRRLGDMLRRSSFHK